jgi:hypothetical protein
MAFVDHNQVKEIRRYLFKGFLIFFRAGDGLVQRRWISKAGSMVRPVTLVIAVPNGRKSLFLV